MRSTPWRLAVVLLASCASSASSTRTLADSASGAPALEDAAARDTMVRGSDAGVADRDAGAGPAERPNAAEAGAPAALPGSALPLWYGRPAAKREEALPVGDGRLGGA